MVQLSDEVQRVFTKTDCRQSGDFFQFVQQIAWHFPEDGKTYSRGVAVLLKVHNPL